VNRVTIGSPRLLVQGLIGLLWLMSILAAAGARGAEPDPIDAEIARLETALDRIGREQQSVYQQFQMVQELRRNEAQQGYESRLTYTPPKTPPNYEDVQQKEDERQARLQRYQEELDRLYGRYQDLESQKQPLLDRMGELAQERVRTQ
jgi:chromosome segregation ATPase